MKFNAYFENKQHGSADFPIALYRVDKYHPQYTMPFHWHNELEIVRVYSGLLELFIDNIPYKLYPRDIAFINCRSTHRATPQNCRYDCLVCDISMLVKKNSSALASYINPLINESRRINSVLQKENSVLYYAVTSLFTSLDGASEYYELGTMSSLFLMFEQLYKRGDILTVAKFEKSTVTASTVAGLAEWIDKNYSDRITLKILSEKSGITPNYLCRIFKEYTGKTPIEYINSIRIENVCSEIIWSDKSITAAAIDNGFDNISYFCRVFKSIKGISAKEYIKQNTELQSV